MSYKVTLWPSGEVLELNGEENLLQQLKKAGKKIKSSCGGCATCGDCVLVVKSGEMNLSPQSFEELRLLGNVFHITKERLSCQTKITGDVTLDISGHEKIDYIDIIREIKRATDAKALIVKIPYSLFHALLWLWGLFDRNPPFTTQQLAALVAKDEFEVIDWPAIFGVSSTPFADAIYETFCDPRYSPVVLEF